MNHIQNLYGIGIGGTVLFAIIALLWFEQGLTERRYRFIGDHGRYCFNRMWRSLLFATVFAGLAWAARLMGAA